MDQEISFELLKQRVRNLENETARLKRARKKTYLMQQCLDGAGDVIFWIDKDANIVYVNKAIQRNFGFSRQELVSQKIFSVMLLEQEDNWLTFFQDVVRKGRLVCESNSRSKAGEDIVVEVSVSSLQYKGKEIVQAYVRSISKQKEDEHTGGSIRLEYEAVQKQLQAAIRERLETEKILTAMQAELELLKVRSELEQQVQMRKKELAAMRTPGSDADNKEEQLVRVSQLQRDAEEALLWARREWDQQELEQKEHLFDAQQQLDHEIKARKNIEEELGNFRCELERITQTYTDEVTSLRALLQRKEDVLGQLFHHNNNTLEALAVFFTSKGKKVKKKKQQDIISKHKNILNLYSFILKHMYQPEYPLQDYGNVYMDDIVNILHKHGWPEREKIRCSAAIDRILISADKALALGLIIYELVENGFKHAFSEKKKGKIRITFHRVSSEEFELSVQDNGIGLMGHFESGKCKTMGLPFVGMLVQEQLQGTLQVKREKGTECVIRFRLAAMTDQ